MMHSMVSMWSGARQLLRSLRESAIALVSRTLAVESIISVTHLRLAAAASGGPALSVAAAPATWIPEAKPTESVEERLVEAPPTEERPASRWRFTLRVTHERAVTLLAAALSIAGFAWYSAHGDILAYEDAVSHMMIARRVLFSPTPGLGQLGTVWPPFNHILMLPFVWIEPLYRSGLAGALPSMACYVIATLYLFRSAKLLFSSVAAGWVAAAIFALNPNTLYLQSTPMSELVLLGMIVLGLFHLFRWVETERVMDLVICAAAFAAGTLVRYDAWALAAVELLVIAFIAWRRHGAQAAEAMVWLYSMLAFAGCVAWVLYNWVLFGDPLYFLDGPYSAKYQEDIIKAHGGLPTYHNVI
ncbi:MAG TPA: glycosyltransferase family 39 protein, partial [Ktedonobacterales bacterium]